MAAAALLRSVARKLARLPPPPKPHPLARGLHDGAYRSSAPGSLPPPTNHQMVGLAAAAGLRSGAGAASLARKPIARTPPPQQGYHRFLHERRLHGSTSSPRNMSTSPNPGASGFTPPPSTTTMISDKDLIESLRFRLSFATFLAGAAGTAAVYLYFWALPDAMAQAYYRGKSSGLVEALKLVGAARERNEAFEASLAARERIDPCTKDVQDNVEAIQACIKGVEANLEATEACIKDIQANVEATKAYNKDIQANLEATEACIKDIQANVKATKACIKDIQTNVEATEAYNKDIQANLEATEACIKDIQANVEATEACIKDIQTNVEATEAYNKDIQANLEATEDCIKDVQANLEATEASIKDVQANNEETEASIKDFQANAEVTEASIKDRQAAAAAEPNAASESALSQGEQKE